MDTIQLILCTDNSEICCKLTLRSETVSAIRQHHRFRRDFRCFLFLTEAVISGSPRQQNHETQIDTTQQLADLTMSNMNFRVLLLLTTTTFLFVFLRSIFQHQWKRPPMLRPVMACRWSPIMMVKSVVLEPLKQWNKGSVQLSFHASAAQCCLVLQQPCKC